MHWINFSQMKTPYLCITVFCFALYIFRVRKTTVAVEGNAVSPRLPPQTAAPAEYWLITEYVPVSWGWSINQQGHENPYNLYHISKSSLGLSVSLSQWVLSKACMRNAVHERRNSMAFGRRFVIYSSLLFCCCRCWAAMLVKRLTPWSAAWMNLTSVSF